MPAGDGLQVSFGGMPEMDNEPNYFVLDTDYDTYSVVYSCSNINDLLTFEMMWILSRTPTLSQEALDSIIAKIGEEVPTYNFDKNAHYTYQG